VSSHQDLRTLEVLPELVDDLEVTFPPTLKPYQQELLAALGVRVRFDPKASMPTLLKRRRKYTNGTTRDVILERMPIGQECGTAEIVAMTGRAYHAVCHALTDLVEERLVLRPRRGCYVKRAV
jgi:hypothetical protein